MLRHKVLIYQYNCFYKSFSQILGTKLLRNSIIPILVLFSINYLAAENEINKFPSPGELAYLLTQQIESEDTENTKPASNFRRNENYMAMKKGRNMAIAGTILFFSGVAIEWPLLYPWAREVNKKSLETDDPDSIDTEESLLLLAASVPIGALEISGSLVACIGAAKSTNALRLVGLTRSRSTHVWKPYIAGWVLGGAGAIIGLVGGLAKDQGIIDVGTGFGVGQDVAWGVATIWALIESVKNYKSANSIISNVSIIPYCAVNGTGGCNLCVSF